MFKFENVESTEGHLRLRGNCKLDAHQGFFKGHFAGQPIMPAAAQLQMVDALIQSHKAWQTRILGGRGVKFLQRILPDEIIELCLIRRNLKMVEFTLLKTDMSVATKGILTVAGETFD